MNHEVKQYLIHWKNHEGEECHTRSDEVSLKRHLRYIKRLKLEDSNIQIEDITNQPEKW